MRVHIRLWASLVKTSAKVTSNGAPSRVKLRYVNHLSLPVYRSANTSQKSGTRTMPRYSALAQKIFRLQVAGAEL